jgi:hypothetical protein
MINPEPEKSPAGFVSAKGWRALLIIGVTVRLAFNFLRVLRNYDGPQKYSPPTPAEIKLTKQWRSTLFAFMAVGLILGLALRQWFPDWLPPIVSGLGYLSGIFAIGTSNVFQADDNLHFKPRTQRKLAYFSALALASTFATMFS